MKLDLRLARPSSIIGLLLALALGVLVAGCSAEATAPGTVTSVDSAAAESVAAEEEIAAEEEVVSEEPAAPQEEVTSEESTAVGEVASDEVSASTDAEVAPDSVATDAEIDWTTVQGRTDDNRAVMGNPDAPVTLIEYSDFM